MSRRHLFDNGFPVSTPTLLAGSAVLIAVANAGVRSARLRLALSLLRLTDTSGRVIASLALRDSRDNLSPSVTHGASEQAHTAVEDGALQEPGERPAREAPHRR